MYFRHKATLILLLSGFLWLIFFKPSNISDKTKEADGIVNKLLSDFNLGPQNIVKELHKLKRVKRYRYEEISKTYEVVSGFSFDRFRNELSKKLVKKRITVSSWGRDTRGGFAHIELFFKNNKIYTIYFRGIRRKTSKGRAAFKKAKVAIVIDDFGYNLRDIDLWAKFEKPITLSILPNLAYSSRIDKLAALNGKEVILHLPLEPHRRTLQPQEQSTINTNMSKTAVIKILSEAMRSVPHLKGVSNHQGSKATEDRRLMTTIFKELNRKHLFFLDSLVTNKSVCRDIALKTGLKFAQRDIFLDNINEMAYIKTQLSKLADLAQQKGSAVGVGHDRPLTIQTLKAAYRLLESRGIEFVYISELVR